jgi:hypothetical protein
MVDDREQYLRRYLADMAADAQRKFIEAAQPIIDELAKIESRKPPRPILLPDGTAVVYVGPRPAHMLPAIEAPREGE